jgi:hypothetical protein
MLEKGTVKTAGIVKANRLGDALHRKAGRGWPLARLVKQDALPCRGTNIRSQFQLRT